jgi:hypothetical protein
MSHLEDTLASHIKLLGLPEPKREFTAIPGRRFRWDFAWPQFRLLLEVQGGTWGKGGKGGASAHSGGVAASRDCEKGNLAVLAGWKTLNVTTDQIRKGEAIRFLQDYFGVESRPGDFAMIREALLWNVEECTLSLCLDALERIERTAMKGRAA